MIPQSFLEQSVIRSIREGWLDRTHEGSVRLNAILYVCCKVDELNELPPVRIFSPAFKVMGCAMGIPEKISRNLGAFIYLNPLIELCSPRRARFYVAHELAHIVLAPKMPRCSTAFLSDAAYKNHPNELAADKLAESWGFKRPKTNVSQLRLARKLEEAAT